jgi:hypothetical protein
MFNLKEEGQFLFPICLIDGLWTWAAGEKFNFNEYDNVYAQHSEWKPSSSNLKHLKNFFS